jgi:hypothetical protein
MEMRDISVSNYVDKNDRKGSGGGQNHGHYLGVCDHQPIIPVEGINVVEPFTSVMNNCAASSGITTINSSPNYREKAKYIDETCRYVFPVAFTIFIVIYWTYYLVV